MTNKQHNQSGQAMVEFSLVMALFLMLVFVAVRAAMWDGQDMASASAISSYASAIAASSAPGTSGAATAMENQLKKGMFGTIMNPIITSENNGANSTCPTPATTGHANVCIISGQRVSSTSDSDYIEIAINSRPALFGANWSFALPVVVTTYIEAEGFAS